MKKLLSFLIGWSPKPKPANKRAAPAHEVALKQALTRRRPEEATNGSPDQERADPRLRLAAEDSASSGGGGHFGNPGDTQTKPAAERRKKRKVAKHQAAAADADGEPGRKKKRRGKRA